MMWRSSKIGLPTPSKAGIGILLLSSGEASGMPVATGSMPVVIGRADQGLRPNMCCHDVFVRYDITNGSAMPLQMASDPLDIEAYCHESRIDALYCFRESCHPADIHGTHADPQQAEQDGHE